MNAIYAKIAYNSGLLSIPRILKKNFSAFVQPSKNRTIPLYIINNFLIFLKTQVRKKFQSYLLGLHTKGSKSRHKS